MAKARKGSAAGRSRNGPLRKQRPKRTNNGAERRNGAQAEEPSWATASEASLLRKRVRNLGLKLEGSPLEARVERLYDELEAKGLDFRPHVWLSTTFFSPDGVPGFAVPFYLAHPRLTKLELARMGRVEGADEEEFMRVVRHETGHAILSAYGLHKGAEWRRVFGRYSDPYRISYRPDPRSREYVLNLDGWYAQSHPAEDFCETFAVWLRPRAAWKRRHARTPVLRKLEFVDAQMRRIRSQRPAVRNRERVEPLSELAMTLGQFYRRREALLGGDVDAVDAGLRSVFESPRGRRAPSAAAYLRRLTPRLVKAVRNLTGKQSYDVEQVVKRMIERSRALGLVVPEWPGRPRALSALVTVEVLKLYRGRRQEFVR